MRQFNWVETNLTSNTINKFERKIRRKRAVRARKRFTADMNDIIKIIKSSEHSEVLIGRITENMK